jgi:HSP20 family molecular chaperone IbpA
MLKREEGREVQHVPVNLYGGGHELVAVAPVPGLTAEDIEVEVADHSLAIKRQTGPDRGMSVRGLRT